MIRIIINGKKAGLPDVRAAVTTLRQEAVDVEVRVTWEHGDAERLVNEAADDGVRRLVAAGGDGTLSEVVSGLAKLGCDQRPELAIMPLGTANDFATACNIPPAPLEALQLAVSGNSHPVDVVRANERYFINVASGGFGAQVAADTPPALKNFLGGGAYTLSAVVKALNYSHSQGRLLAEGIDLEGEAIMGALCNGRQAGGGQVLAPNALIDDGLLDVLVILAFPFNNAAQVIQELLNPSLPGEYVKRFRTPWVESWPRETRPVNLDGEPYNADHIRFECLPGEIRLVLPDGCPCLSSSGG